MKIIKNLKNINKQSGFTLLEILLVVAAIGILAGIVIFAINPGKQLGDTRNAQRRVDINTILNGLYQYSIDHNGTFPVAIPADNTEIWNDRIGVVGSMVDLSALSADGKYITAIPVDPQAVGSGTGYVISADPFNHIYIQAINAENGVLIDVKR